MALQESFTEDAQDLPFTVAPLTPGIGAELLDIDLSADLPDSTIAAIKDQLLRWKVVFFRDQEISRAQHIAFARRFGALEIHPTTPKDQPDPEVLRIVHDENSKGRENAWHSDVTWRPEPSLGSILRAIEVPEVGGDTLFADMGAAYEGLSDEMKRFVSGLTAEHDFMRVFGDRIPEDKRDEVRARYPVETHPVVRTHPETGEHALYVNIGFTTKINGLAPEESDWLLNHLWKQAHLPERQCRFRWQKNSIAFWDNRSAQHYAASDYWPARREMERVTIAGDRPFYQP